VTLTLQGDNLAQMHTVSLIASDGLTVPLTMVPVDQSDAMEVVINDLDGSLQRETMYTLDMSSTIPLTGTTPLTITLRDYLETRLVEGIREEYAPDTDRIAINESGQVFTRLRTIPDFSSDRGAVLRSGDRVDILRDDTADWYEIRIFESSEAESQGERGWVERWLVDNEGLPEALVPTQSPDSNTPFTDATSDDE
jgi:hypothetical protein